MPAFPLLVSPDAQRRNYSVLPKLWRRSSLRLGPYASVRPSRHADLITDGILACGAAARDGWPVSGRSGIAADLGRGAGEGIEMTITKLRCTCKDCSHVWEAEIVTDAPLKVTIASMRAVRCRVCGSKQCLQGGTYANAPNQNAELESRAAWWTRFAKVRR